MGVEQIPASPKGPPNNDKLRQLDDYVRDHIDIYPTKLASEDDKDSPPVWLAQAMQRFMTEDHRQIYGAFSGGYAPEFDAIYAQNVVANYESRMGLVGPEYGTKPGASLDDYYDVGINRTYEDIREEIVANTEVQNVARTFLDIAEAYREDLEIEPWEAVRFAVRLIKKNLPSLIEHSKELIIEGLEPRLASREVFMDFLESEEFEQHLQTFKTTVEDGQKVSYAFNYILKEGIEEVKSAAPTTDSLELFQQDFEALRIAYHLGERPFSKNELLVGQELLDTDLNLKVAILVFQQQLMEYISDYLSQHPERLAHTFEHLTEIFLTAENEAGEISLIPNPKLIKVISRNVIPAIARAYIEDGEKELTAEHIRRGAVYTKDLQLFQSIIGEFHNFKHAEDDGAEWTSFFSQSCPAFQPFSKALIEVLPKIFQTCRDKNIELRGPQARMRRLIETHIPEDEREVRDKKIMLDLLDEDIDLLDRETRRGHFTGSALVVDLDQNRFLLHYHKKLNKWFQFGGHPEGEPDMAEVAQRESAEESGFDDLYFFPMSAEIQPLDIDVQEIPEKKDFPAHLHLDLRYILATNHPEKLLTESDEESSTFRWFNFSRDLIEVESLVDPRLYRMILKAKRIIDYEEQNAKS